MKKLLFTLSLILFLSGPLIAAQQAVTTGTEGTPADIDTNFTNTQNNFDELYTAFGGLTIGSDVQAYDADLTTYAGITPSANVQSTLGAATYAAARALWDLEAGTDFYSMSAADAAFEGTLTNEAGLYGALSDVALFYEPGDTLQTNSSTSLPGTCTVGELYLDTDADTDGELYLCVASDTWKAADDDGGAGGSTTMTDFDGTAWRVFYTNGSGEVTELILGASGTLLQSNGVSSAPSFVSQLTLQFGASIEAEGSTADDYEHTISFTDPTADRTTTIGNYDGQIPVDSAVNADGSIALADEATALAANGSNCPAGSYPLGVDEDGAVEGCTDATTEIDSAIAAALTIISGTSTMGTSSIASGACATTVTTTATGAATTDAITFNFNSSPLAVTGYAASANGGLFIYAWPTSNNVNFSVCNNTASAITPGARTLNWSIVK